MESQEKNKQWMEKLKTLIDEAKSDNVVIQPELQVTIHGVVPFIAVRVVGEKEEKVKE